MRRKEAQSLQESSIRPIPKIEAPEESSEWQPITSGMLQSSLQDSGLSSPDTFHTNGSNPHCCLEPIVLTSSSTTCDSFAANEKICYNLKMENVLQKLCSDVDYIKN